MEIKKYWHKLSTKQINEHVFAALQKNKDYHSGTVLGIPASYLDDRVFYDSATFLHDAPYMNTLIHNPNHIGCHTRGRSMEMFAGTQAIEKEVISICAEDILGGIAEETDGYVATGGTEANLQAVWVYRNFFKKEYGAAHNQIAVLCSEDAHYSANKAADIFNLPLIQVKVQADDRQISEEDLDEKLRNAKAAGLNYFIVIVNMMTTMFGSVDDDRLYVRALQKQGAEFKIHVDGAFGGFLYPFTDPENRLNFRNEHISSFTLDAHKIVAAPYGTGIFLIRKGLIESVCTQEAQYIDGLDVTVSGSRSGANAVSVWLILATYGPYGWAEKMNVLVSRAKKLTQEFDRLGIDYFRQPHSNIVTARAKFIPKETAERFGLAPDTHERPAEWYKIVVMDHVGIENLVEFIRDLESRRGEVFG